MSSAIPLHVLTQALHALDVAKKTVQSTDYVQMCVARGDLAFHLKPILAAQHVEVLADDADFAELRQSLKQQGEPA